ncbi:MAG: cell wall-active antibiotics response protein [Prevotellaceae bacterium]|jgi:predicted membrane protein|nr:cell wall-active antibiotics response protein [Prevotellaceae bacterium]
MNAFYNYRPWHRRLNTIVVAAAFIIVGLLILGRNLGVVSDSLYHTIVSWQMLLIVIGAVQLVKRRWVWGVILVIIGAYSLLPGDYSPTVYWPVILILVGFAILSKLWQRDGRGGKRGKSECHGAFKGHYKADTTTDDGFVRSDVSFGHAEYIVLDPVFRGADLDVSFGAITLDLRRTTLTNEITYIDVDASFSGVVIYVPLQWNVELQMDIALGGVNDERARMPQLDEAHQLVIRGDLSLGGITLKG